MKYFDLIKEECKILPLRVQKLWYNLILKRAYKNIPFEIAHTDISDEYEYGAFDKYRPGAFDKSDILAEFDADNKHYVILRRN